MPPPGVHWHSCVECEIGEAAAAQVARFIDAEK
jgi:hypothetical protein